MINNVFTNMSIWSFLICILSTYNVLIITLEFKGERHKNIFFKFKTMTIILTNTLNLTKKLFGII